MESLIHPLFLTGTDIFKRECEVKSFDGNNCPNEGVRVVDETHYLCEDCYKNYLMYKDKK